jgi:NAD(P)H-dependent flavin oxidoreductase YrpB (nitropropane dioxygenase family)
MHTNLCDELAIRYPIFGFTPSPEVAVAISKAGGLGVLGAIRYTDPSELEAALTWMDKELDGLPYGVDVVIPHEILPEDRLAELENMIPQQHRDFVENLLRQQGVPEVSLADDGGQAITGWMHAHALEQVEVALRHPIALLANALGAPPAQVIAQCKAAGIKTAALAGKAKHALRHRDAGVDYVVAQGHEAGGHCGEVTTMVLVPEIVDAVSPTPVLAAGGIGCGRQAAAALCLGAQGVWMGSIWLTAEEYRLEPRPPGGNSLVQDKLIAASSSDTVRSRVISGKPARMLKTAWTEAWEGEGSPGLLPMPLQGLLVAEAEARIRKDQTKELLGVPVGQIVGRMSSIRPVAEIIDDLLQEFRTCVSALEVNN